MTHVDWLDPPARRLRPSSADSPSRSASPGCAAAWVGAPGPVARLGRDRDPLLELHPDRGGREAGVPITITLVNADPIDHEWLVGDEAFHERHRTGTEPHHGDRPDRGRRPRRRHRHHDRHVPSSPGSTASSAICPATRPTGWSACCGSCRRLAPALVVRRGGPSSPETPSKRRCRWAASDIHCPPARHSRDDPRRCSPYASLQEVHPPRVSRVPGVGVGRAPDDSRSVCRRHGLDRYPRRDASPALPVRRHRAPGARRTSAWPARPCSATGC